MYAHGLSLRSRGEIGEMAKHQHSPNLAGMFSSEGDSITNELCNRFGETEHPGCGMATNIGSNSANTGPTSTEIGPHWPRNDRPKMSRSGPTLARRPNPPAFDEPDLGHFCATRLERRSIHLRPKGFPKRRVWDPLQSPYLELLQSCRSKTCHRGPDSTNDYTLAEFGPLGSERSPFVGTLYLSCGGRALAWVTDVPSEQRSRSACASLHHVGIACWVSLAGGGSSLVRGLWPSKRSHAERGGI